MGKNLQRKCLSTWPSLLSKKNRRQKVSSTQHPGASGLAGPGISSHLWVPATRNSLTVLQLLSPDPLKNTKNDPNNRTPGLANSIKHWADSGLTVSGRPLACASVETPSLLNKLPGFRQHQHISLGTNNHKQVPTASPYPPGWKSGLQDKNWSC